MLGPALAVQYSYFVRLARCQQAAARRVVGYMYEEGSLKICHEIFADEIDFTVSYDQVRYGSDRSVPLIARLMMKRTSYSTSTMSVF